MGVGPEDLSADPGVDSGADPGVDPEDLSEDPGADPAVDPEDPGTYATLPPITLAV